MLIEPGLSPSTVDIVVAMNNKIRERLGAQAIESNESYVSVDKITQKTALQIPGDQLGFNIRSSDLKHFFGCDSEQNETRFIMSEKGPHYPQCFYYINMNTFFDNIK